MKKDFEAYKQQSTELEQFLEEEIERLDNEIKQRDLRAEREREKFLRQRGEL